jgi:hypothetical protein
MAAAPVSGGPLPTKNIENNPMHSSQVLAGMDVFDYPEKTFDTSGKSGAGIHRAAIYQMPMARSTAGVWMRLPAKSLQ